MKSVQGIPALGFGTYGRWGVDGEAAILTALETGYRHIDTAQSYNTEGECGRALKASGLARDEVFVTTKIDMANFAKGKLVPSLERSLAALGLDRVDLTLIHWPSPRGEVPLAVYLEQIAQAQDLGLTRHIGVSNFTIALLTEAKAILGARKILTNQVELNPFIANAKLASACAAMGIAVTCYQPIAKGRVNDDAVLQGLAARHAATPAQVALAWEIAKGYIAIPTTGRAERIRENFGALALSLAPADIAAIDRLDRNERRIAPDWGPAWD
jgi:2,5-diketo-D-gluconate reductase B